jgi:hypothetical protein
MTENAPSSTLPVEAAEGIRCSDAEREQVRAALYAAAGEGRLTMEEVEERLGRLEEMRFRHELGAATADLPAPEQDASPGWQSILSAARWPPISRCCAGARPNPRPVAGGC